MKKEENRIRKRKRKRKRGIREGGVEWIGVEEDKEIEKKVLKT